MKKRVLRAILRDLRPYGAYLAITLLSAVIVVAGQILVPYFAGKAVDCIPLSGREVDFSALRRALLGIGISLAFSVVFQWVLGVSNNAIAYRVLSDLRTRSFCKLSKLPLRTIDSRPFGDISNAVVGDAEQFADGLLLGFTQLFTGILTIAGVLGIMLFLRWEIALVVFCITPLSLFAARFISKHTYGAFRRQTETRADETAFADEMIGNLKTVKAFTREEQNERIFEEKNAALQKASLTAVFFSSTTNPVTRFVNALVYAAVALAGGLFVLSTGGMFSVGSLTTFLITFFYFA